MLNAMFKIIFHHFIFRFRTLRICPSLSPTTIQFWSSTTSFSRSHPRDRNVSRYLLLSICYHLYCLFFRPILLTDATWPALKECVSGVGQPDWNGGIGVTSNDDYWIIIFFSNFVKSIIKFRQIRDIVGIASSCRKIDVDVGCGRKTRTI